ncbi:MAG: CotH kinase family protein [Kofleriaceae bacterium]
MWRAFGIVAVLAAAGCGGDDTPAAPDADPCEGSALPAAPVVWSDAVGRIDVLGADLRMTASAYVDADGDPLATREYELWELDDAGALDDRAWIASVTDPAAEVTLADGWFVNGATDLAPWQRYGVRARDVEQHGACAQPGPWSELVSFRADDGSTALFDETQIREFRLELSAETITALNAQAFPPGCVPFERDYYPGTLIYDGVRYEGVGVKTKGGCGSARDFGGKPGLKVSLDWDDPAVPGCPPDRRIGGQKTLTFNNHVQDPSAAHERLGYALYEAAGTPVSRAATVKIYVNDTYYGLYLNLESINRRFLERRFASKGGMLYEGTYWCDLLDGSIAEDDSGCLTREFRPDACSGEPDVGADPLSYEPMYAFIDRLDALAAGDFYPAITEVVDFDAFLAAWAAEAYMAHWDGYNFNIINNYRFYHDPSTDLWTLLPTGIDQTFGGDIDPWAVSGRIAVACRADAECEAAFAAKLAEVNALATTMDLPMRAAAIRDQLRPIIEADAGRGPNLGGFDGAHGNLQNVLAGRAAQVTQHLANHGF